MKILHIITSLETGGAEKLMVDLLPRMQERGHRVEICLFDGVRTPFYEQLESAGIKIHSFTDGEVFYNPFYIIRLIRLMRKGWDVVHTHNTSPELFVAIANCFVHTHIVTTEHSTSNRRRNWKWYKAIDRWMFNQYDSVICISDQSLLNHKKQVGESCAKNACVIYNGIDYNKYKNASPVEDVRALSKKIITNVAGFRAPKDQPTLIRALKHLPDDFHLCLVGDGERREEYETLIKSLSLSDRVHLLGWRSDIPNVLAASDYVVMSSHYEGLSLSSLEGMASGKPFLADDVDGLREVVSDCGVMFKHEDDKGFADAILRLDNDESYRDQIIKQCQAKTCGFDISIMVDKYLEIYENIQNF